MRGESDEAIAPEMQGFFVARVFVREMGERTPTRVPAHPPTTRVPTDEDEGGSVSSKNDVDEDE